ncbi:glutathione S-transferase N-terminal domain-containing protein [Gammaproteobacteria bacterium]|jgi:RNA polymerase-associated protein|nr:glutathione S-transferase N-terminal domain-containing protein [Gammaproteobacteria bacterium]MDB9947848.1 glutathione S-transferase N-terminal domain-containing protein [Gammaproteobacteria bacterium]
MILYSEKDDHYSHRVRIVLAEKDIACDIREVSNTEAPDEVLAINPYHSLPILSDRDLGLYDTGVMLEYLDERFPHPPLLPVYPVSRANSRSLMLRIDKEWCSMLDTLKEKKLSEKELLILREELLNEISTVAPTFKEFPFFMSEDFSIIDCYLAPILWRLPSVGITLPLNRHLKPLLDYQEKIFSRPSFQASLSMIERDLRA